MSNTVITEMVCDWMRTRGVTQNELARSLNLKQPSLSHRITGRVQWHLKDLERLEALGIIQITPGIEAPNER